MPNVEEHLRKAMAEGKFDDLPGKGQPLHLGEPNPHADPEWEMAFHMLKERGFSLPWIETIREIESEIEAARQELRRAWGWQKTNQAAAEYGSYISAEWERAQETFKEKLDGLNERIREYNLQAPNARFQRPVLSINQEIDKITSG